MINSIARNCSTFISTRIVLMNNQDTNDPNSAIRNNLNLIIQSFL